MATDASRPPAHSTPADPAADSVADLAGRLGRDQVFGPPAQSGDTTLVPVARVRAGGGASTGVGLEARPVGAFAVGPDGKVAWHPVVDVNRIVLGGQLVVGAVLLAALLLRGRR
jgi:hypothetical protein